MKIDFLQEPELAFGAGKHIDIRFGLMNYGPLDVESDDAPRTIRAGIVGTPRTVEGLGEWLDRCRTEIPAKESKQPNLFPRFPGFREDATFHASLAMGATLQRTIPEEHFDGLVRLQDNNRIVEGAVEAFKSAFTYLIDNTKVDVLLCAVPSHLADLLDPALRPVAKDSTGPLLDFHDMLKARCIGLGVPIQLVLPWTYDPSERKRQKIRADRLRPLQDEATRAWNLHTALYYKAGGLPWRLIRDSNQFTTCYVGVSFYRSLDQAKVLTSMAQVFDQRGDGMVVKGDPVELMKNDRTPHLSADDAKALLTRALERYRETHETWPARVVVHKTSVFNDQEIEGCNAALSAQRIERADLLSLTREAEPRLFRIGQYPPLRGTFLSLDDYSHLLYTRGSVDFYATYPGMYIPRPLVFRGDRIQETPKQLAREILALTKMNWNLTQFDTSTPITIEAANTVRRVFKYLTEDEDRIAPHYRFYM